jgi:hypothetical protein
VNAHWTIRGKRYDYYGTSIEEIREYWEADRDDQDAGASECRRWPVVTTPEGRVFLSYNGRAWMDDPMKADKARPYAE